jgi:hypothetical protein
MEALKTKQHGGNDAVLNTSSRSSSSGVCVLIVVSCFAQSMLFVFLISINVVITHIAFAYALFTYDEFE